MNTITTWLVSIMTTLSPPGRAAPVDPHWNETAEERQARYEAIAEDIWHIVQDEKPIFAGPKGRERSAAILLATAYHESGFAKDVDMGPCVKKGRRCDSGRSACMLQIRIGSGTTIEGWTQADLFADRTKCFRSGLNLMRRSFVACRRAEPTLLLSAYAGGVCDRPLAQQRSREIWSIYETMIARHPIPSLDSTDQT